MKIETYPSLVELGETYLFDSIMVEQFSFRWSTVKTYLAWLEHICFGWARIKNTEFGRERSKNTEFRSSTFVFVSVEHSRNILSLVENGRKIPNFVRRSNNDNFWSLKSNHKWAGLEDVIYLFLGRWSATFELLQQFSQISFFANWFDFLIYLNVNCFGLTYIILD